MKSWKTSVAGILGLVGVALAQLSAQWDADPLTVANWNLVFAMVPVTIGLLLAKDGNVTGSTKVQ